MRCARCHHVWYVAPDGAPLPLAEMTTKEPSLKDKQSSKPEPEKTTSVSTRSRSQRRRAIQMLAGWAGLGLVLALFLGGGYLWRNSIVRAWPQTATLYAALGVAVNPLGMMLRNVTYNHSYENGLPVLTIRGEIVNITNERIMVPEISVQLKDARNKELYGWNFSLDRPQLPPKAKARFITRLSSPPAEARHLEVRFARGNQRVQANPSREKQNREE